MGWLMGRTAALADPERARAKVLQKLHGLAALDDPEAAIVPILMDAVLLVESYRGARHRIDFLDGLSESVDAMLREIDAAEKAALWAAE